MPFTVRVRGVEIVCATLDDVDALVGRYGTSATNGSASIVDQPERNGDRPLVVPDGAAALDQALLSAFVNAGRKGVLSETVTQLTGAKGKAISPALQKWAQRVGLARDGSTNPCERAFPEGQRGWKLTDGALGAAKLIGK